MLRKASLQKGAIHKTGGALLKDETRRLLSSPSGDG